MPKNSYFKRQAFNKCDYIDLSISVLMLLVFILTTISVIMLFPPSNQYLTTNRLDVIDNDVTKSMKSGDDTDIHVNNTQRVNISDFLTYPQTGSIYVRDNGTLEISNATINFIQQYDEQFKIEVKGKGVLKIRNGRIRGENNRLLAINLSDDAKLVVENSTLYMNINVSGNAVIIINNSNVMNKENLFKDWATLLTTNSSFNNSLVFADNATGIITNTTVPSVNVSNNSVVVIHQWLIVNVRDSNDMPVQFANVSVRYHLNDTIAYILQTDEFGKAVFNIHTNTTTSERDFFVGHYKVIVNYSTVEVQHNVSITSAQDLIIPLPVSPDIVVKEISQTATPVVNETNYLNIAVENTGITTSPRTLVRTFADYFVNETFVDPILPNSIKNISINWMPKTQGYNTITVGLDPNNSVNETDKTNNNKSKIVWVRGRSGPIVGLDAFTISNTYPTDGESVWLNATPYNDGETNATDVLTEFYIDNTSISNIFIPLFPSNSTYSVPILWNATHPGSHTISVVVGESNKSSDIWVRTKPDFVIKEINVSSTSPLEGSDVWINATLYNNGETNATNVSVRFYIDGSSISENVVPVVITNSSYTLSAFWNATSNSTRTIIVRADPESTIQESNEMNNNASAVIYVRKIADLTPIRTIMPSDYTVGESLNITAEIYNRGENEADNVFVRFYDNNNAIGETSMGGIASNSSKYASVVWKIESVGQHIISVEVDPNNLINEGNETNNILSDIITIKSRPDLTILNVTTTPAYPLEGESVEISIMVSNIGGTDTEANVSVYLNAINTQSMIGYDNVSISSNSEALSKIMWHISNITGVSTLCIVVNSSVNETDISNNLAKKDIIVYSQRDRIIKDNEIWVIDSDYLHTGSILVKDNGMLSITNSELKLVQNKDYQYGIVIDNGTLCLNNGNIKSNHQFMIYMYNNSRILLNDSVILVNSIVSLGNATLVIKNSNIEGNITGTLQKISIAENSKIVGDIFINSTSLEVSSSYLTSTLNVTSRTISLTNSTVFGAINLESFSITLTNVITDGNFVRLNSSSISINDSIIKTDQLGLYGANITTANSTYTQPLEFVNSTVNVINITAPSISIRGDSALYKYWWLTIVVSDYADTPVPNAGITVRSLNGNYTINTTTDSNGLVVVPILTNTSLKEEHFVGNYEVDINYSNKEVVKNLHYKIRSEYNIVLNAKFTEILIPPTNIQLDVILDNASSLPNSKIMVSGDAAYSNNIKVSNANITVRIVETATKWEDKTDSNGHYEVSITTPNKTGTYTIAVEITDPKWGLPLTLKNQTLSVEQQKETQVQEKKTLSSLQIMLIVIAISIGILSAFVFFFIYLKRLKHVVECNQCGLVLPHHQRRCPNCETEFDDTLAKCSECKEIISITSKECPKCGVKFIHK